MKTWDEKVREATDEKREELSLDELLRLAQEHEMTARELHEQRISFAMAMVPLSNTTITREDIEHAAAELPRRKLKLVK